MDWKRKLTSRKLWVAIASFVSLMVMAFGVAEEAASQITAIIMAGASMIAYIIGEGLVDKENAGTIYVPEAEPVVADRPPDGLAADETANG